METLSTLSQMGILFAGIFGAGCVQVLGLCASFRSLERSMDIHVTRPWRLLGEGFENLEFIE